MIYFIAYWGLIILSVGIAGYVGFYILLFFAKKEAIKGMNIEWQKKLAQLQEEIRSFESRKNIHDMDVRNIQKDRMEYAIHVKNETNKLSQLKDDAIKKYDEVLASMKTAERIRENAQLRIDALRKQVSQLQSELFNARKRGERLAKRNKEAV